MNVLVLNGWSDDNKGDAAILQGLIRGMQEAWRAKSEGKADLRIDILSTLPLDPRHHRHTIRSASQLNILPPILPRPTGSAGRLGGRLARVWHVARSLLVLVVARRPRLARGLLSGQERTSYDSLARCDLAVSKGGHIFFSTGGLSALVGLYCNLFPLLLAQRLDRHTVVYGQSIGPIRGGSHTALLRWALRKCDRVLAREPQSLRLLEHLRVPAGMVWDTAFLVRPEPIPKAVESRLPDRFVAMTVRSWHFPYGAAVRSPFNTYIEALGDLVRRLDAQLSLPVVLVPQVIGPMPLPGSDYGSWDALDAALEGTDIRRSGRRPRVIEVREDLTPGQLISLYELSTALVGTRFHSVILALGAGVPSLAISYHGFKAVGIMEMLGLERYCVDIQRLEAGDLWRRVSELIASHDRLSQEIAARMEQVRHESLETVADLLDRMSRGVAE
jgi:colanic acid/amylovoran biosynthesis protein